MALSRCDDVRLGAAHDTLKDLNAGLDLEMNGSSRQFYNLSAINLLLASGQVTQATLDEHVRRILRMIVAMGFMDRDQTDSSIPLNDPQNADVALNAASEGIVLLKNESHVLPLDRSRVRHIIVTGPNGEDAVVGGGGSSRVDPFTKISVLQAVQTVAGSGVKVEYMSNLANLLFTQSPYVSDTPDKQPGLSAEYFANADLQGSPVTQRVDRNIDFNWDENSPMAGIPGNSAFSARWHGTIAAPETGDYVFAVSSDDGSRVFLDDNEIIDSWSKHAALRKEAQIRLEKGQVHRLRVEYFNAFEKAEMHFGWSRPGLPVDEKKRIGEADAVVYAGGLNSDMEQEGRDRPWDLPSEQIAEISQLAALNPHLIVAINAGGNLGLGDNLAKIPALLWAWYPGQNGNLSLAKIIFGDLNPSGHLPDSFEKRFEDAPAFGNYPGDTADGGKVHLDEGIYVGYRWFDKKKIEPAFPFGFGLSYTSFALSNLRVTEEKGGEDLARVSFQLTNTGTRAGAEVVQLYVRPGPNADDRPLQELKGFKRVMLKVNELQTVTLPLAAKDFATYDEKSSTWIVPGGTYQVAVGTSSRDIAETASINIAATRLEIYDTAH